MKLESALSAIAAECCVEATLQASTEDRLALFLSGMLILYFPHSLVTYCPSSCHQ